MSKTLADKLRDLHRFYGVSGPFQVPEIEEAVIRIDAIDAMRQAVARRAHDLDHLTVTTKHEISLDRASIAHLEALIEERERTLLEFAAEKRGLQFALQELDAPPLEAAQQRHDRRDWASRLTDTPEEAAAIRELAAATADDPGYVRRIELRRILGPWATGEGMDRNMILNRSTLSYTELNQALMEGVEGGWLRAKHGFYWWAGTGRDTPRMNEETINEEPVAGDDEWFVETPAQAAQQAAQPGGKSASDPAPERTAQAGNEVSKETTI